VDTEKLNQGQCDSFKSLLDDPSPAVRDALLEKFVELGDSARQFLIEIACDPNRILAPHAQHFLRELKLSDPGAEFIAFIRSMNYELESGILLLARAVNPTLKIAACRRELDAIAARCAELTVEPSSPHERCRIINRVLFHEWAFRGNVEDYNDPRNSLIDQVLARRKGLPITMSILYVIIAERLELELQLVGMPSHVMVGCYLEELPFFIDPFDRGIMRKPEEIFDYLRERRIEPELHHLAPTPAREIFSRCCLNLINHSHTDLVHAKMFASFVEEFAATYERNSP
tara:strand:- start:743 stop:1603 length:861 start_codon:yes stop_codon:yes gene_type:complete